MENFNLDLAKRPYLIISHKEDMDGVTSATIIKKSLLNRNIDPSDIGIFLVNYQEINEILEYISITQGIKELYISDLGINKNIAAILPAIGKLKSDTITRYFDHHHIPQNLGLDAEKIRNIYNEYHNSIYDPELMSKEMCASDIVGRYFQLYNDAHFKYLVSIAHLLDFSPDPHSNLWELAQNLKKIITFHQAHQNELLEMIETMLDPSKWAIFIENIDLKLEEIDKWFQSQFSYIDEHQTLIEENGYKFACATADIRASEIAQYLGKKYPDYDVYFGLSRWEKYMNLRTSHNCAHKVASHFHGGGHGDRAGFSIPDQYWSFFEKNPNYPNIPEEFRKKIIDFFLEAVESEET